MPLLKTVLVFGLNLLISDSVVLRGSPQLQLNTTELRWLHIPKTGTSFLNTLFHWACPGNFAPEDLGNIDYDDLGQDLVSQDGSKCPPLQCIDAAHVPLGKGCMDVSPGLKFVSMFRQPEQHKISAFHHDALYYNGPKRCKNNSVGNLSLPEYAKWVSGCQVRMMTGYGFGPGPVNVTQAIHNLHTKFAFVGLVEEWKLSVCLFHQMLGGAPDPRELQNVRIGKFHDDYNTYYDTAALDGFTDQADGALYDEVKKLFWHNIEKFGVTHESCRI